MTIKEIQKVLSTSFKNGVYVRRPSFNNIELYINKDGKVWQCEKLTGHVFESELMKHEFNHDDWEIV